MATTIQDQNGILEGDAKQQPTATYDQQMQQVIDLLIRLAQNLTYLVTMSGVDIPPAIADDGSIAET